MQRHVEELENRQLLSVSGRVEIVSSDPLVVQARGVPFTAMIGDHYKEEIGVLRGVQSASADLSNLSGTINWGDDSVEPNSATFRKDHLNRIHVMGSHQYFSSGKFTLGINVTETINSASSSIAQFNSKAQILEHGPGGTLVNPSATQEFTDAVANFHDAIHTDIRATIDWGDGSSDAGVITTNGHGHFVVTGTHTYLTISFPHIRVSLFSGPEGPVFRVIRSVAQVRGFA